MKVSVCGDFFSKCHITVTGKLFDAKNDSLQIKQAVKQSLDFMLLGIIDLSLSTK